MVLHAARKLFEIIFDADQLRNRKDRLVCRDASACVLRAADSVSHHTSVVMRHYLRCQQMTDRGHRLGGHRTTSCLATA